MGKPWQQPRVLNRASVSVGASSTQVLGPNLKRAALLVSAPLPTDTPYLSDGTLTGAASTATTGVKSSYTVPAGVQATLLSATQFETTGTTVVSALQLVRGATTYNIASATNQGSWTGAIDLQAGDVVQWNVTTAVALSVCDFTINIRRERVPQRVTLDFDQPAVLDQGLTVYQGQAPLYLSADEMVGGIIGDVHAIASVASVNVNILEWFYP